MPLKFSPAPADTNSNELQRFTSTLSFMQRTGHRVLDRAIEEYIALDPEYLDEDSDHPDAPQWESFSHGRLSDMRWRWRHKARRATQHSTTRCGMVADHFTRWLVGRGIDARMSDDLDERDWAWHGYTDRSEAGLAHDPSHCATIVRLDGHIYMIDWTASQYGYREFPMVQRAPDACLSRPNWQREWPTTRRRAAAGARS